MLVKRFEKDKIVTYTFSSLEDLKIQIGIWKEQFRLSNRTDEILKRGGKDSSYEKYCKQLDDLIDEYTEG